MVYIHGGAFAHGSGTLSFYSGSVLSSNHDVVMVTLNYRLGALGFLALPNNPSADFTANFGILDIIKALEW